MNQGQAGDDIELRHADLAVRVSRRGAAVTAATYRSIPFLVAAGGPDGAMANFAMVPFGNRVEGNAMSFAGQVHAFQANASDPLYLHGDGWLSLWQLEDASAEHARFSFSRSADGVSPYAYFTRQEIRLTGDALVLRLSVENRGEAALPFGLGQHPFFARTPKTRLTIAADRYWSERPDHLPEMPGPLPDYFDFRSEKLLPQRWMNNAFEGWNGRAAIVWPELGIQAALEADGALDRFMLYMPVNRSDFFCLEPMSHLPNGHHLPDFGGLAPLAPGEDLAGTVTILMSALPVRSEEG
ncbi:aldose 1-epimerase [Rhizobium laguerreae]|uniref:Aldose 1-epimerase n=1 Tax=Rhizobium laguerreae TaxID=1076926 RepID=A0AAX2QJ02_9HYPH|nr:aldose 1-epimerase [Rhizobium laguerreae]MBY3137453.1 aldose 1-epimerase [Rhizobium laguerreae]MBY3245008.1 aldose 1-epimerase [Rhizobium laguerreae]MBY3262021.1 aldose 1-epimerase [Rhizobium laguerreae]MBY3339894.1 aldose 1-epimerase [Rhizobium laguerreae]MBY3381148.1 aldose 1-epimerase [Rhizobium laguerreae]